MFPLNRKTLLIAGVAELVLTVALIVGAYFYGNSRGYTNACEHTVFLMSQLDPNPISFKEIDFMCNTLKARRTEAQDLMDQARSLSGEN